MGDVFNWNSEEENWDLSNVEKIPLDTSDFCVDFPDKNYLVSLPPALLAVEAQMVEFVP